MKKITLTTCVAFLATFIQMGAMEIQPQKTKKMQSHATQATKVEGHNCTICLETDKQPRKALPCGHSFHTDCINPWLVGHSTCPICRADSVTGQIPGTGQSPTQVLAAVDGTSRVPEGSTSTTTSAQRAFQMSVDLLDVQTVFQPLVDQLSPEMQRKVTKVGNGLIVGSFISSFLLWLSGK